MQRVSKITQWLMFLVLIYKIQDRSSGATLADLSLRLHCLSRSRKDVAKASSQCNTLVYVNGIYINSSVHPHRLCGSNQLTLEVIQATL